ncbi:MULTISPECIES: NCS2 family permease [Pseudoalteromonas]|uniref:NCS2 family permease n=1 Tax=Pseudoalteromonas TaxID=53246 RepID=UPI0005F9E6D4|nr:MULTISPECIES: NCS2 family permease [Pseudoalteromonas]MBD0782863.1 NCS2 family permease [Pseudoalteromonas flavipulchra]MBE0372461.1 putative MFS transporter, AGZA family, xanthine/uracil permease [Pseudoalteromonas flavipulchra NCIMB 2033 = ATCC BAA-314]MCG9771516.1 NCS2 family permease [Pseudoalteromonas piscicida]QUI63192.1 NCS2 family permease [Pseudoalteromonas sp. A22]QZO14224.1 NCS2 family permease [Pseudoalteromonas piscicida]
MLERLFSLQAMHTNVRTEVIAGLTTFVTMVYIVFVNPAMLAEAGMDHGAAFVATCIAAAIGCFIMGLWANYPLALAPGMGLNAFFTYGVVLGMGYTWQSALGAVFMSGCLFLFLSVFKVREWVIQAIPIVLKRAIAAGIGAFLALIALKNAKIVIASDATLVQLGDITSPGPLLAIASFFVIAALMYREVKSGVLISILMVTGIAWGLGLVDYHGVVDMPPSIAPTYMQLDLSGIFELSMLSVVFAFLFVDLFDTSGTLVAVTQKAGLSDEHGRMPRLGRALSADSTATIAGSVLGTSTTTSYIESVSGVSVGGRTGLTAVVVGICFLLMIFFAPLAQMVPAYATAGAILYVSVLMLQNLKLINWDEMSDAIPVSVVLLMTPLTFSIAHGIALGFISYTAVKLACNKANEISISVWVLTVLFIVKFAFG